MKSFETMTHDEFNAYLCEPLRILDKIVRERAADEKRELTDDYRQQLVEQDRYMMEAVAA